MEPFRGELREESSSKRDSTVFDERKSAHLKKHTSTRLVSHLARSSDAVYALLFVDTRLPNRPVTSMITIIMSCGCAASDTMRALPR